MHDKILSGEWRLNRVGDPVWYTDDGIIAVFPEITHRMVQSLRDSGEQGVVHDSMQVLEILADYVYERWQIDSTKGVSLFRELHEGLGSEGERPVPLPASQLAVAAYAATPGSTLEPMTLGKARHAWLATLKGRTLPKTYVIKKSAIQAGGPVHPERGFVIHDDAREWDSCLEVGQGVFLTTSRDILEAMAAGDGPRNALVALGCAGWGAGQLEFELGENSWLTAPSDANVLFATGNLDLWHPILSHYRHIATC
ncbi:YqgE/AlgH family protein [Dickeya chrysanthemi]|uniref:YqgE/AlgH family protein n=1 Tax=Dickeya chrysanthemi TaxID=556 RepID=UPI0025A234A3|nr:YqgE/AlgH family protein [Dickeya chrysanthemi]WJM85527.1 YqgE/AlgH family protein [Dickeya chrysanthemi]